VNAVERNLWIDRSTKYLRLVADHIDSIVITTKDGDTIEFRVTGKEPLSDGLKEVNKPEVV